MMMATLTSPSGRRMHPRIRLRVRVAVDGRDYQTQDLGVGGFGLADAGLDFATPGRLSGFIEGDGDFGGGLSGGGGRVGLRFRW